MRLAVGGIGVAAGESRDGLAQVFFCRGPFAAAQVPASQRSVAAGVKRIATKGLPPIELGLARRVPVLFEV